MAPTPDVSFVVLSYNFSRYLGECVASILSQEGDHAFEIIVVDDASTDDTPSVLDSFTDPRVRVIRHAHNQGHAATVNDGMAAARGALIARIDGDDCYRPSFLNELLPLFACYPEVGLVYADVALIDGSGIVSVEGVDVVHGGRDFIGNELVPLLELNFICAPTVIARREAWQSTLPVPGHLAFHDWYFTTLIARRWAFAYRNKVLADYRVHPGNLHTRIMHDRTEEPSILWLLHRIFRTPEADPALQRRKQRARRRIYGRHYLVLADKYFGAGMNADARRCYLRALLFQPRFGLRPSPMCRLLATWAGRERYERFKAALRMVRS